MIIRFAAIAVTAVTIGAAAVPAHAQLVQAQVIVGEPGISIDEARDIAAEQGLRVIQSQRYNRDTNRWEIEGRDMDGRDVEMELDANTGEVMDIDRD